MKTTLKQSYLRIGALLLALMLTVGCLSGCGSAGAENSGGTRTVTDMADRTVELPAEINSIATFGSIGVINTFVEMMDLSYFKLLDTITIARSRKHIEKYYNIAEIGRFPKRLPPKNLRQEV